MFSKFVVALVIFSAVACAVSAKTVDRIVGGAPANITDYPWQVSISDIRGHFCGGSIIDRRRILTAAHCLYGRSLQNPDYVRYLQVRIGSANRTSGGIFRSIRRAIIHENYNRTTTDNDIAILVLSSPILYTCRTSPVALPGHGQEVGVNQTVIVSGWGTQQPGAPNLPEILHSVAVDIVDQEACRLAYARNETTETERITDNMLCAGIENVGGKDSCQGDSGGPLVEVNGNHRVLHGIVSWGYSCALASHPGVYTRVSRYNNWIRNAY